MKVYYFRMSKADKPSGVPPRPGLVPARVIIGKRGSRAHLVLRAGPSGKRRWMNPQAQDVGRPHAVFGHPDDYRSYYGIIYIREEDIEKAFSYAEEGRLSERAYAEWLLANRAMKVGSKRVKNEETGEWEFRSEVAAIRKVDLEECDGLGGKVNESVLNYLEEKVIKLLDEEFGAGLEGFSKRDFDNAIRNLVAKITDRKPGASLGFFNEEKNDKPMEGESEQQFKERWRGIRRNVAKMLTWYARTLALAYRDDLGEIIPVQAHPYVGEESSGPELPATARGEYFALTRKVASGNLMIPIKKGKVNSSLYGKIDRDTGKRFLTKDELDTLVAELMGSRVSLYDEHGNSVVFPIPIKGDVPARYAKNMWQYGLVDVIVPITMGIMRKHGVYASDLQRCLSAALLGMMERLGHYTASGKKNAGKNFKVYATDPALALMEYVAKWAVRYVETEAINIRGEREGDEWRARMTVGQRYGGKQNDFRLLRVIYEEAQRRNVAMGIWEEPSPQFMHEVGKEFRGSIERLVDLSRWADKPDDAWEEWLKERISQGIYVSSYDPHFEEEDESEQMHISPGQVMRDAQIMSHIGGQRPKTVGQIGEMSHQIRVYERDAHGNFIRGRRDLSTGKIALDPNGPLVLAEEFKRNSDGTFMREETGVKQKMNSLPVGTVYQALDGTVRVLTTEGFEEKKRALKPSGDPVAVNPYNVHWRETRGGMLEKTGSLVLNPKAYVYVNGGTSISPEQIDKAEVQAKLRLEALNRAAADGWLDATKAMIFDMVYSRGTCLNPFQEYYDDTRRINALEAEYAKLKGQLEPLSVKKYYDLHYQAAYGQKPKGEDEFQKAKKLSLIEQRKAKLIAENIAKGKSGSDLRRIKEEAEAEHKANIRRYIELAGQLRGLSPEVHFPDAAPPSMWTEGMMNYPSVPVDEDGRPMRELLYAPEEFSDNPERHLGGQLSRTIVDNIGKPPPLVSETSTKKIRGHENYDVALHVALRNELQKPRYRKTIVTSIDDWKDFDNPDLRRVAKIFFEGSDTTPAGSLPATVELHRTGLERGGRTITARPRELGLEVTNVRGVKKLQYTERKPVFPAEKAKLTPDGKPIPMVFDHVLGKMVPLYGLVNDENFTAAYAQVREVKGYFSRKGWLNPDSNQALPTLKELKNSLEPGMFNDGPPVGTATYKLVEDEETGEHRLKKVPRSPAWRAWKKAQEKAFMDRYLESVHGSSDPAAIFDGEDKKIVQNFLSWKREGGTDWDNFRRWCGGHGPPKGVDVSNWVSQVHLEILKEHNTASPAFRVMYSKLMEQLGITLGGLANTHEIMVREQDYNAELTRRRNAVTVGPREAHKEDTQEGDQKVKVPEDLPVYEDYVKLSHKEGRHPILRHVSVGQVIATLRAIESGAAGIDYQVNNRKRSEVRPITRYVFRHEAYETDEKGRYVLDKEGNRILKPGVLTETKTKLKTRGGGGRYKGPEQYEQPHVVEPKVVPKRPIISQKEEAQGKGKATQRPIRTSTERPAGHESWFITGRIKQGSPSEIPVEHPSDSAGMDSAPQAFGEPAKQNRVLPPVKTQKAVGGGTKVLLPHRDPSQIKPTTALSKTDAVVWANTIKQTVSKAPKYETHGAPVHEELKVEHKSTKAELASKAHKALIAEIEAQNKLRAKGKKISSKHLLKLKALWTEYRKYYPEQVKGSKMKKDDTRPEYMKRDPRFAFSETVYVFPRMEG